MTRINALEPHELTILSLPHLRAIWKEYNVPINWAIKYHEQGKSPQDIDIPQEFTLNKGHVKFFVNKLDYVLKIMERAGTMLVEQHGFSLDWTVYFRLRHKVKSLPQEWRNDWIPKEQDKYITMARLVERNFKTEMKCIGREVIG